MEHNTENEKKSGFTVSELEGTAKKYASEIGLAVIFVVTALFTLIWGGAMMVWSVILCMALAVVGACTPNSMMNMITKALDFVYKEKAILIATGIVLQIVAIFVPVLIFAVLGLIAGGYLSSSMKKKACCCGENRNCKIDNKESNPSSNEQHKSEGESENKSDDNPKAM